MASAFYVYVLKNPLEKNRIFYVGKGTGIRAYEHGLHSDETNKGKLIQKIKANGKEPIVTIISDSLEETAAYKLEAELISFFGIEGKGGILLNTVQTSGVNSKVREKITVPLGTYEKANLGLNLIKEAFLEILKVNPLGLRNGDFVKVFNFQSDYLGGSKDYLSWSLLGILMREGKVVREEGKSRRHLLK